MTKEEIIKSIVCGVKDYRFTHDELMRMSKKELLQYYPQFNSEKPNNHLEGLHEVETSLNKLHRISTPAKENWLEIQKKWEEEDGLDEAAEDSWALYEYNESPRGLYSTCYVDGFKAGAEWMKDKDTRDMYMSDNRHFQKVYELGRKDEREQMMNEAVEVGSVVEEGPYCPEIKRIFLDGKAGFKPGDKVKLIIIKEEGK